MAINLVAYPDGYGLELLTEILCGAAEKVREAGAVIAGGHTVTDKEPKYGLAVTGVVDPQRILSKSGARPGDRLILTKPLGTGVITTALKGEVASEEHIKAAIASMARLNRDASRLARKAAVHAMTDITGYSLLGHGHEMAHLSGVDLAIQWDALRWLPGALDYGARGLFPGGMWRNREFFETWTRFEAALDDVQQNLLFDPQTSGGLLIAAAAEEADALCSAITAAEDSAAVIGE